LSKSLLDTDIISEILKGIDPNIRAKAIAYRSQFGFYTTSVISVMEIVEGWHRRQNEARITQFLGTLATEEVLPMTLADADLAGRIYVDLERTGQRIGYPDCIIGAIAINNQITLVTGNTLHYQRIQTFGYSLLLDNWR
jgi:tRNA(fMet)-specific endonuclease VapC